MNIKDNLITTNNPKAKTNKSDFKIIESESLFNNISKHSRYVSDWDDNEIIIDGSLNGGLTKDSDDEYLFKWDLSTFILPPNRSYKSPMPLTDKKELTDTVKVYINEALMSHMGKVKSPATSIARFKSFMCFIIEWMWINDIYKFAQLNRKNTETLITDYASQGRSGALKRKERYEAFINEPTFKDLTTLSRRGSATKQCILGRPETVYAGINISNKERPSFFIDAVFNANDDINTRKTGLSVERFLKPSGVSAICNILGLIKSFYYMVPEGFDKPSEPLLAINNTYEYARKLSKIPKGRTKNINIDEFAALLTESLSWIYDYSEGILKALNELCEISSRDMNDHYKSEQHREWYTKRWATIVDEYGITFKTLSGINSSQGINGKGAKNSPYDKDSVPFGHLIKHLSSACYTVIAIMNARRVDEVKGKQVGLTYNCLTEINNPLTSYICEMYIEKTVKDYVPIEVNKLTADAINVLKKIVEFNNPDLKEKTKTDNKSINLFRIPAPSNNGVRTIYLDTSNDVVPYFEYATRNCEGESTLRSHSLRRITAILYMYRFEIPSLLAVKDMLFHSKLTMTQTYITDPDTRETRQRIDELWPKEQKTLNNDLEWASEEWYVEHISGLIDGSKKSSGGFIKMVRRYVKILALSSDFSFDDPKELSRKAAQVLIEKNFVPKPARHGDCMAPDNGNIKTSSRCFDKESKSLKKEKASANLCTTCPYHWRPEGNLHALNEDLSMLIKKETDITLPLFERKRAERDADNLRKAIALSKELQNKRAIEITSMIKDVNTRKGAK